MRVSAAVGEAVRAKSRAAPRARERETSVEIDERLLASRAAQREDVLDDVFFRGAEFFGGAGAGGGAFALEFDPSLHLRSHLLRHGLLLQLLARAEVRLERLVGHVTGDVLIREGGRVATVRAFHGVGVRGAHHPAVALLELAEGFASLAPDVRLEAVPARVVTLGAAHALRDGAVAEAYRTRLHESGGEENVSRGLSEGARRRRRRARGTFVHPPALGVRGNAGARERPLARGQARARDVARTFTSAAIVAHLARRAVSSAPRAARRHRSTRARHVDDQSRVPTVTVSVARFFQSRRVITRARS